MNRIAMIACIGLCLALPSWLAAQTTYAAQTYPAAPYPAQTGHSDRYSGMNHGEFGVYGDYLRFSPGGSTTNFAGVNALVGVNFNPNVSLEAMMSYDFAQDFTSTSSNGVSTTLVTSSVRPITGLFGPKIGIGGGGPFRAFATGKVGFIDFSVNNSGNVSGSTFSNSLPGIGGAGTHLALYPGGGIEAFAGWFGIRAEAGDLIYLNNGTYNDLRITFGPTFRF